MNNNLPLTDTFLFLRPTLIYEQLHLYVFLDVITLLALASTCRYLNTKIRAYLCRCLTESLHDFLPQPAQFIACMRSTRTIISGSFTLQFIFGSGQVPWNVHDLDLYTIQAQLPAVKAELQKQGYHVVEESKPNVSEYSLSEIFSIVKLWSKGHTINLVVSRSSSPVAPIFQFHSTIIMNYISVNSLFAAFPTTTAKYISMPNPSVFFQSHATW
ncbi:hypothetical protein JVT61DRAFT_13539 [Boletus reticuloceps]|uniref:Uncharacterized protein n=1 Tax=Boletus reticuloceps TaxID=495285 RepID=A0A8I2YDE2_9AGAM|nr:hypothetical protein JVT61DRAFT_13539 [Boletus reticuloceps]